LRVLVRVTRTFGADEKVEQLTALEMEIMAAVGPPQTVSRWWEAGLDAVAALTVIVQLWHDAAAVASVPATAALTTAVAAVALRRTHTVAAVLAVAGVSAIGALVAPDVTLAVWILAQVCLFSVPLRRSRTVTFAAAAGLAAVLFADAVLRIRVSPLDPVSLALVGWTAAVAGGGLTLRAQRDYLDAVQQQARAAVVARDSAIGQRVTEERLRIARDLHDAVAHNIAVISLHAGAAEQALTARPSAARDSLRRVRAASRTVLGEMQAILSVLRSSTNADDQEPLVSAAAIPDLLARWRALGVEVVPDGGLDFGGLDPAADVAAYRLLQEALTNAHRHGRGPVRIGVTRSAGQLRLTVTNQATPAPSGSKPGFGLIGMRERVTSAGGTLDIRRGVDRFELIARLPLREHHEKGD
jgi:signal transduction histidine kinase